MEDLRQHLIRLHREYPNNMDFGEKVRSLVHQMMEQRSQQLNAQQLPGQIDLEDMINEVKNGGA